MSKNLKTYVLVRINRDPRDVYADFVCTVASLPLDRLKREAMAVAANIALPDEGSRVEYAMVRDVDASSARRQVPTTWLTLTTSWSWETALDRSYQGWSWEAAS